MNKYCFNNQEALTSHSLPEQHSNIQIQGVDLNKPKKLVSTYWCIVPSLVDIDQVLRKGGQRLFLHNYLPCMGKEWLNGHKTPLPKDILSQLSLKLVLGVWEEVTMWNVYSLQNDKYFCNRALKNSSGKDIIGTWLEYNDKHFENW